MGHVLGRAGECWVEAGCRIVLETGNSGYVTDMAFKEEAAVQNDTEGVDVWWGRPWGLLAQMMIMSSLVFSYVWGSQLESVVQFSGGSWSEWVERESWTSCWDVKDEQEEDRAPNPGGRLWAQKQCRRGQMLMNYCLSTCLVCGSTWGFFQLFKGFFSQHGNFFFTSVEWWSCDCEFGLYKSSRFHLICLLLRFLKCTYLCRSGTSTELKRWSATHAA